MNITDKSNNWNCSYSKLPSKIVQSNENIKLSMIRDLNKIKIDAVAEEGENDTEYNDSLEKSWFSREFLVQLGIIFVANLSIFIAGMHTGWVGPTILKLSSNTSEIPLTSTEISWLTAMVPFGGGIGPIFGAILANKIGRKTTILLITIPEIFTWIAIIFAKDIYCLCTAQLIRGITGGSAFVLIPMYIGEISSPKFRGFLGMFFIFQHHAGIVFEAALVPYVSLSLNAWISMTIPILLVLIFIWMPESPYYYIMKNKLENARNSLKILKQNNNVEKQLEYLKKTVRKDQSEVQKFSEIFRTRNNRISFILCLGIFSIQHLTGLVTILVYCQLTLNKSDSPLDPNISGIIIHSFGLLSLFLGFFVVDSYGRRPLLLMSTFGSMIPLLLIAIYFQLDYLNYEYINFLSLLPLVGLALHQLTAFIGITPIPYVYISESFSMNIKGFASLFIVCYGSIMHSLCNKIYPYMCDALGIHSVYYLLILGCFVSGIGTYYFVPETKGRTLHDIQILLNEYSINFLQKPHNKNVKYTEKYVKQ